MKSSVIIICYNRMLELKECIDFLLKQHRRADEIIVIDNNSSDGTENLFANNRYPLITYIRLHQNLGVAGGRNYGIRHAKGDVIIFIDDDALLEPSNALDLIVRKFIENGELGILTFKIVNYYSKKIQREEFPHIDKSMNPNSEFETSYYIGCGHAIRRELFEKCGLYPDDFFYGFEELDLSFRAIDKGYKIMYFPEVIIYHKKASSGRMSDNEKWKYSFRNRLAISYKYLNNRHFIILAFIWFLKIAKESRGLLAPVKGLLAFWDYKKTLIRTPISEPSIKRIINLRGRIWY